MPDGQTDERVLLPTSFFAKPHEIIHCMCPITRKVELHAGDLKQDFNPEIIGSLINYIISHMAHIMHILEHSKYGIYSLLGCITKVNKNIVEAFRGMHVSPAKYSYV